LTAPLPPSPPYILSLPFLPKREVVADRAGNAVLGEQGRCWRETTVLPLRTLCRITGSFQVTLQSVQDVVSLAAGRLSCSPTRPSFSFFPAAGLSHKFERLRQVLNGRPFVNESIRTNKPRPGRCLMHTKENDFRIRRNAPDFLGGPKAVHHWHGQVEVCPRPY
jgi:hypothetical protein